MTSCRNAKKKQKKLIGGFTGNAINKMHYLQSHCMYSMDEKAWFVHWQRPKRIKGCFKNVKKKRISLNWKPLFIVVIKRTTSFQNKIQADLRAIETRVRSRSCSLNSATSRSLGTLLQRPLQMTHAEPSEEFWVQNRILTAQVLQESFTPKQNVLRGGDDCQMSARLPADKNNLDRCETCSTFFSPKFQGAETSKSQCWPVHY